MSAALAASEGGRDELVSRDSSGEPGVPSTHMYGLMNKGSQPMIGSNLHLKRPGTSYQTAYFPGGGTLYDINGHTLKSKRQARVSKQRALYWYTKKNARLVQKEMNFNK